MLLGHTLQLFPLTAHKTAQAIMSLLSLTINTDHQDKSPLQTYNCSGLLIILSITTHFENSPTVATDSSVYPMAPSVSSCQIFQSHMLRVSFSQGFWSACSTHLRKSLQKKKVSIYIFSTIIQETTFWGILSYCLNDGLAKWRER